MVCSSRPKKQLCIQATPAVCWERIRQRVLACRLLTARSAQQLGKTITSVAMAAAALRLLPAAPWRRFLGCKCSNRQHGTSTGQHAKAKGANTAHEATLAHFVSTPPNAAGGSLRCAGCSTHHNFGQGPVAQEADATCVAQHGLALGALAPLWAGQRSTVVAGTCQIIPPLAPVHHSASASRRLCCSGACCVCSAPCQAAGNRVGSCCSCTRSCSCAAGLHGHVGEP